MRDLHSRRGFIAAVGGCAAGVAFGGPGPVAGARSRHEFDSFPHQDPALVRQVVQFAHFDEGAVRELVTDRPALAKASWDWGFGDWETPLGAASHVGQRTIAAYLLGQGARPNIFTFAMLGHVDAVRAIVEAARGVQRIAGPHGLSLLHHARVGGDRARDVLAYLEEVGDADPQPFDLPLAARERAVYLGSYRFGGDGPSSFEIVERRERIAFQYAAEAPRDLLNQGDHEFHPVGAEAVRFRFSVEPGGAVGVSLRDGGRAPFAERVG